MLKYWLLFLGIWGLMEIKLAPDNPNIILSFKSRVMEVAQPIFQVTFTYPVWHGIFMILVPLAHWSSRLLKSFCKDVFYEDCVHFFGLHHSRADLFYINCFCSRSMMLSFTIKKIRILLFVPYTHPAKCISYCV